MNTAEALRQEFDRSFAEAPKTRETILKDFLAVRVGGDPYVIDLLETAGLHADRKVVPVPSRLAELLGVVGLRGVMVPVYDLRLLLGYPGGSIPRWLVLARGPRPVGLAFELFEQHLRIAQDNLIRPVINLASLIETIAQKER